MKYYIAKTTSGDFSTIIERVIESLKQRVWRSNRYRRQSYDEKKS